MLYGYNIHLGWMKPNSNTMNYLPGEGFCPSTAPVRTKHVFCIKASCQLFLSRGHVQMLSSTAAERNGQTYNLGMWLRSGVDPYFVNHLISPFALEHSRLYIPKHEVLVFCVLPMLKGSIPI